MKTYFEIAGDGGSNILEQVQEQKRRIQSSLSPLRHVVAIGSGKGGVGKSTITMLLALSLRARGHSPAILDADLNGPSQARLGGLKPALPLPSGQGLSVPRSAARVGIVSLGSLVPEPEAVDFPSVSSGDSYVWRATKEFTVLGDLLAGTDWSPFDLLLLDLPPGVERTLHYAEFLGAQARFVLVTLPSSLSRGIVARSVSALGKGGGTMLGYIENMRGYCCPGCGQVNPLFPASEEVSLPIPCLGSLPFDPALAQLCDTGITLTDLEEYQGREWLEETCDKLLEALQREDGR